MRYNSFGGRSAGSLSQLAFIYRKQLSYAGAGAGLFYLANLDKVSESGRYRFMIVPKWLEMKVGSFAYAQVMAQYGQSVLPSRSRDVRRVNSVMDKIIGVSKLDVGSAQWEVNVIDGNYPPNAFVLPGGKVFVFRSMLSMCATNDELAAVLSHETAHQVCRHTAENLSKTPIKLAFAVLMQLILGVNNLDNLIYALAFELPASRQMEREADEVGLKMMARACFNPEGAVSLWQRMVRYEQRNGGNVPQFLSTHPASQARVEDMRRSLPAAEQIRSDNCSDARSFFDFVN